MGVHDSEVEGVCFHCLASFNEECVLRESPLAPSDPWACCRGDFEASARVLDLALSVELAKGVKASPGLVNSRIFGRVRRVVSSRVSVEVYSRDVRVVRKIGNARNCRESDSSFCQKVLKMVRSISHGSSYHNEHSGRRREIKRFSRDSQRRLLFVAGNLDGMVSMATLTYPGKEDLVPKDGKVVKAHWAAMRHWLTRRKLAGLMFMEFQERGAPHFHVFLNGRVDKSELSEAWNRIAGHCDPDHLRAGTKIESIRKAHALAAYAGKYAAKQSQKDVPEAFRNVGRFWSLFGKVNGERLKVSPLLVRSGEQSDMAPLVRIVRGLMGAHRRTVGLRPRRDNGMYSFLACGISAAVGIAIVRLC